MNKSSSQIFANALKLLLKSAFKLLALAFAWSMRLLGLLFSKMGEATETIIIKRSSV
jgi:hypothetical protein